MTVLLIAAIAVFLAGSLVVFALLSAQHQERQRMAADRKRAAVHAYWAPSHMTLTDLSALLNEQPTKDEVL